MIDPKRRILLSVSGIIIAIILIGIIALALNTAKNIFKAIEDNSKNEMPAVKFQFEKLKSTGVINE